MSAKKSFKTSSGQDFEFFVKKINFFDAFAFNYKDEGAIGMTVFKKEGDKDNKYCFLASFNDNYIHFSVSFDDLVVPPERYEAFSKATARLNVDLDNQATCLCAFAYKPGSDVRVMLSVPYTQRGAVERIRKAFLTIWGTSFLYRQLLENVAEGRAFNRTQIAYSILKGALRFAFLLEEVADARLSDYYGVMALVASFADKYGILDNIDTDDEDEEEDDPFNLFGDDDDEEEDDDSFNLFDDNNIEDDDEDGQDAPDDESVWDEMSRRRFPNEWNAFVDFIARFMNAAMGVPFHAKSAQRRQTDL